MAVINKTYRTSVTVDESMRAESSSELLKAMTKEQQRELIDRLFRPTVDGKGNYFDVLTSKWKPFLLTGDDR